MLNLCKIIKLPKEVFDAHIHDDKQEIMKLMEYGIRFKCDLELAAKTFQVPAITMLNLQNDNTESYTAVMEVLLNGVINEIVGNGNN